MNKIADYGGKLLNHVEALGCAITDTGFKGDGDETFLAVHPNPDDRNIQNNAFYMSPMRPEQQAIEEHLKRLSEEDPQLGAKLASSRVIGRRRRTLLSASRNSRCATRREVPFSRLPTI